MPTPLTAMYLLSVLIVAASFAVSRGPDGQLVLFLAAFSLIGVVYVSLAWVTRHQPMWLHLFAHLVLFATATAVGMAPKPRLQEMAGTMYYLAPAAIIIMFVLASLTRFLARWF